MFAKDVLISIGILLAFMVGLHFIFEIRLPALAIFALYFAIYFPISWLLKDRSKPKEPNEWDDWPTSGPIGRYGQKGLIAAFSMTGLLSFLNPFQVVQMIKQAKGNAALEKRLPDPDTPLYENKVSYTLPFEDEWFVYNGGVTKRTSHSWDVLTQRYAYDFVVADQDIVRHKGKGTRLEEYYCYRKNILSAADGEVVEVVDGIGDAPLVGYGVVDFMSRHFAGNHVIVRHAEGEYGFYAHLIKRSIHVKVGDSVTRGQVLGHCGHSGHSSEPHLHFHLQDGEDFFSSMGLPVAFSELTVNGETRQQAHIECGSRVRNSTV